jgi:large subunit ribosomal protein L17
MRHQNKIKKLGRTAAHRKATLAAMSSALIEHKRIETTLPKAKALRSYVEPLITRAKEDTTANRRQVFRRLQNKEAVKELFGDIAASVGDRPGGYTRVIKLGLRQGDSAEMAMIELVDYNDVQPEGGTTRKRTRRGGGRRRRSGGGAQQSGPQGDSLTKVYGVGKAFAQALNDAGITTYQELADADLQTLRKAISADTEGAVAIANEETWAEQARFLAADDKEGHEAYIDRLREEDAGAAPAEEENATEEAAPETPDAGDASASAETSAEPDEAEAPAAQDASTQPDDAPETPADEDTMHPDTPQGSAPGTGEPPPETGEGDKGTSGGSQHRG